jgi:PHS family inorganic phosphate transporter-like MFS transporter
MSDHNSEEIVASKNIDQQQISAGDRRRAALSEIDEAKFGWVHVKACLVAGVGFFTDA